MVVVWWLFLVCFLVKWGKWKAAFLAIYTALSQWDLLQRLSCKFGQYRLLSVDVCALCLDYFAHAVVSQHSDHKSVTVLWSLQRRRVLGAGSSLLFRCQAPDLCASTVKLTLHFCFWNMWLIILHKNTFPHHQLLQASSFLDFTVMLF